MTHPFKGQTNPYWAATALDSSAWKKQCSNNTDKSIYYKTHQEVCHGLQSQHDKPSKNEKLSTTIISTSMKHCYCFLVLMWLQGYHRYKSMCVLCAVFVCTTQTQDPHQRCLPLSAVKKGPIDLLKILPLCIFVCYIQKISMKMQRFCIFFFSFI